MEKVNTDVGEHRALQGKGVALRSAIIALLSFYVFAGWLNGRAVHEEVERRTHAQETTIWTNATAPLHRVATTPPDQFRSFFETILEDQP
jgi:hypothetical protein